MQQQTHLQQRKINSPSKAIEPRKDSHRPRWKQIYRLPAWAWVTINTEPTIRPRGKDSATSFTNPWRKTTWVKTRKFWCVERNNGLENGGKRTEHRKDVKLGVRECSANSWSQENVCVRPKTPRACAWGWTAMGRTRIASLPHFATRGEEEKSAWGDEQPKSWVECACGWGRTVLPHPFLDNNFLNFQQRFLMKVVGIKTRKMTHGFFPHWPKLTIFPHILILVKIMPHSI